METERRLQLLLAASPETLTRIDRVLAGQCEPEGAPSLRLLRVSEAAAALGLSRSSIWRLCREKKLPVVSLRRGSRRIPESALREFVGGKNR